jgi:hypothetical protein
LDKRQALRWFNGFERAATQNERDEWRAPDAIPARFIN